MERQCGKGLGGKDGEKYGGRNRKIGYYFSQRNDEENYTKIKKQKKGKISISQQKEIKARAFEIIGVGISAIGSEIRRDILQYIKENKEVTFEELRRKFNLNNNTLTFHLQKLLDGHIISQQKKRGRYQVGDMGNIMLKFLDALKDDVTLSLKNLEKISV